MPTQCGARCAAIVGDSRVGGDPCASEGDDTTEPHQIGEKVLLIVVMTHGRIVDQSPPGRTFTLAQKAVSRGLLARPFRG